MKIHLMLALAVSSFSVFAGPINHNCKPNGVSSYAKEMMDSRKFWADALKYIDAEEVSARREIRVRQIERENDKIRDQLSAREEMAAGVYIAPDAKTRALMAEDVRESIKFDREMLRTTLDWVEKCRDYATKQLKK